MTCLIVRSAYNIHMTDILCPVCKTPMTGEFMCCPECSGQACGYLSITRPCPKPPLDYRDQQIHDLRVLLAEKEAIIRKLEKAANTVAK